MKVRWVLPLLSFILMVIAGICAVFEGPAVFFAILAIYMITLQIAMERTGW